MNVHKTLQHLLPHHLISRIAGFFAHTPIPWIKNPFIRWFVKKYQVDMSPCIQRDPLAYATFSDFFTRQLHSKARPIATDNHIACPADGAINECGDIVDGQLLQAKGMHYSLASLLADTQDAKAYNKGSFCTVYLSPRDYHRVHMPCKGRLVKMTYVPGKLFSVSQKTAECIPEIFARNERAICHFEGEQGPFAVIFVGAMIVGSIHTRFHGQITPTATCTLYSRHYDHQNIHYDKGEELGFFTLGSTAIVLFPQNVVEWDTALSTGTALQMGQSIGVFHSQSAGE